MSKTALVLIAEGSEEIEAIAPGDILNRCGVDVTYASVGTTEPRGGHGVPMRSSMTVDDIGEILFDAVVVPGGGRGAEQLRDSPAVSAIIRRHWEAGKIVAAICAAPPVVLGPLGILTGKHAACFPGLERMMPKDCTVCDSRVCVDGKLITSQAAGTALEFSLRVAEHLVGAEPALKVGHGMLVHGL